jgi:methylglutaconyl-CoA hydratase
MDTQQQFETILLNNKDRYLEIRLNRPEVRNAMNPKMIEELTYVISSITESKELPVAVVLQGEGKSFCAGADLNYMKEIAGYGFEENVKDGRKLAWLFSAIYDCPVPTIALVHGAAFGGANGLLASCDVVLAADDTKFAFSEVKLGISPATIAPFVMKRIGETGAKALMLSGKRFDANEAKRWNLVNEIMPADQLETQRDEWIKDFRSSAPKAVQETKKLIKNLAEEVSEENVFDYTAKMIARLRASEEGQEGMAAFLEKRKASWNK